MGTDWITTEEAAKLTGYHVNHVRRLVARGRVTGRKFGPVWQVSRQALLAHVRQVGKAGRKRGPKPRV